MQLREVAVELKDTVQGLGEVERGCPTSSFDVTDEGRMTEHSSAQGGLGHARVLAMMLHVRGESCPW